MPRLQVNGSFQDRGWFKMQLYSLRVHISRGLVGGDRVWASRAHPEGIALSSCSDMSVVAGVPGLTAATDAQIEELRASMFET